MNASRPYIPSQRPAPLPVVWTGLLGLIAILPIPFGGYRPWAWSAAALWSAALLGWWAVALWRDRDLGIAWQPLFRWPLFLLAAVVGWILVQACVPVPAQLAHPIWSMASAGLGEPIPAYVSVAPSAMPAALMRLLTYAIIFWLVLQLCRGPTRVRSLLTIVGVSTAVYALYELVTYGTGNAYVLWYPKWAYHADLTSVFVNRNSFATYAAIGMLTCVALSIDSFRRRWRRGDRSAARLARRVDAFVGWSLVWSLLAFAVAGAWLQSHSRMGFVSGVVGLLAFYLVLLTAGMLRHRGWLAFTSVIAILAVLLLGGELTLSRLLSTSEVERLPLFATVVTAIGDAPWLGTGYGSFPSVFQLYRDGSVPGRSVFTEAHNGYLELALELGLPAAIALIGAIAILSVGCLRAVYQLPTGRIAPALAAAVMVLVGLHATLDFSLQIPAVAVTVAALLGAGLATTCDLRNRPA